MLIPLICVLATGKASFAADTHTITLIEILVTIDDVTISVNVPSEYSYIKLSDNVFEITFHNCGVNVLNEKRTSIKSFMPFFENIELMSCHFMNAAKLFLKLKAGYENLSFKDSRYLDRVEFSFKAYPEALNVQNGIKPASTIYKETEQFIQNDSLESEMIEWPVLSPNQDQLVPLPTSKPVDLLPKALAEYPPPLPEYPSPIGVITKIDEGDASPALANKNINAKEIRKSKLLSIYYSQGRIDRDVITFEFDFVSPSFDFQNGDPCKVVMIFHNLYVPLAILPQNESRCEVSGTLLKSIGLYRIFEAEGPALKVVFTAREPIKVDVDDMEGIMDIVFMRGSG